jgi:hypothetical protein
MSSPPETLEAAWEILQAGLAKLVSGPDWTAMLDATAAFHSYSAQNVMLLVAQGVTPDQRVAGYRAWQAIPAEGGGTCQVAAGAKGHRILAPIIRRATELENEAGERRHHLVGFRLVVVFDESQLVRPPLLAEVSPVLLTGGAPPGVEAALRAHIEARGFSIAEDLALGGANGLCDYGARVVSLRPGLDPAQRVKTLAHEAAHVALHEPTYPALARPIQEVEAESVAWLVTRNFGLAADGYTWPYVAHWSGGDLDVVRSTLARVIPAARVMSESLASRLAERELDLSRDGHRLIESKEPTALVPPGPSQETKEPQMLTAETRLAEHPALHSVGDQGQAGPLPATLAIRPWIDPSVEALGLSPRSTYVEAVWGGILGPTSVLLYRRLGTLAAARPDVGEVDLHALSLDLGVGPGSGKNSPIRRATQRLVDFGAARWDGDVLEVRRALRPVRDHQLARLSPGARSVHERTMQTLDPSAALPARRGVAPSAFPTPARPPNAERAVAVDQARAMLGKIMARQRIQAPEVSS